MRAMSTDHQVRTLWTAIEAVRAAARASSRIQNSVATSDVFTKADASPATVADYASQAIICATLESAFPHDRIVGEEDTKGLRKDAQAPLLGKVANLVHEELGHEVGHSKILDWIDRGSGETTGSCYWTLDPIDGTRGFLRGEQYAIALALVNEGEVTLGALACPNLVHGKETGVVFGAMLGDRTRAYSLWDDNDTHGEVIQASSIRSPADGRFCESVESQHTNQDQAAKIAHILGITAEPYRIDSQCKYAAVARGDAAIYLRLPTSEIYREKIWDHAAGKIILESAGGTVSDLLGNELDFRHGKTLDSNTGVVATCGGIHREVIEAIQSADAARTPTKPGQ